MLPIKVFSETNLTPWGFEISTGENLIYAGDNNINIVKNLLIQKGIVSKNNMNKLINALDSKKIIYLFPKSGGQNVINANTQRDLSTIPVNDYEIKKLCEDMNQKYNSFVEVNLKLKDCKLEYNYSYKAKINSGKFSEKIHNRIRSILFYSHNISEYNRTQIQYYVNHGSKITTFTLGCVIGTCEDLHKELIQVINSINFI